MSTLQQRPHGIGFGGSPQPYEAGGRERDGRDSSDPAGNRPAHALNATTILRYGSLAVLVIVLLAGYWKPHPLPSLALPAMSLVWWWPVLKARRVERWLYFYIAGIYLYTVLRAFADDSGIEVRADYVIAIDRFMFLGNVPSVELQATFFRPWDIGFLDFMAVAMHWSFFIVPHGVFAFLWFRRRSLAPTYGAAVLITLYLGLLLFWVVPTVPPWLAARQGELGPTYRVMNFVTSGMHQNAYRDLYATLAAPNPVASVPSIHMALTFLVLLWVRETAPKWTLPVLAYNLAMGFSLVYLGEHYVFDLLVGIGVATIGHYALRSRYVRSGPSDSAPPPDRGVLVPVPVRVDG